MVKSKLVNIIDEGTSFVICVTKFDPEDQELMNRTGWEISERLVLITEIDNTARSAISTFKFPHYDIQERSNIMGINGTTTKMCEQLSKIEFDDIPSVYDVRKFVNYNI